MIVGAGLLTVETGFTVEVTLLPNNEPEDFEVVGAGLFATGVDIGLETEEVLPPNNEPEGFEEAAGFLAPPDRSPLEGFDELPSGDFGLLLIELWEGFGLLIGALDGLLKELFELPPMLPLDGPLEGPFDNLPAI